VDRQVDLPRCGRHEIVATDDVVDALGAVVGHYRQVVRRYAVVASEYDVVDRALDPPDETVVERHGVSVGAQAQRRTTAGGTVRRHDFWREIAARTGIRTGRSVRRGGRRRDLGEDLPAGAEAFVHEPACSEFVDRRVVDREPVALPDHLAVPVEPEQRQIAELSALVVEVRLVSIEILHAHEEPSAPGARRQPRDRCGAEIAEVEVAGR